MCETRYESMIIFLLTRQWKLADTTSRSATPTALKSQTEPMEEEYTSPAPQDTEALSVSQSTKAVANVTQSIAQGSKLQQQTELPRSQLTPSPVLGLLQSSAVAKSPAGFSTHSSLCSVEETQSPGLAPSLHFLREAHNYLGRYIYRILLLLCSIS
jgi:hypothetical protein